MQVACVPSGLNVPAGQAAHSARPSVAVIFSGGAREALGCVGCAWIGTVGSGGAGRAYCLRWVSKRSGLASSRAKRAFVFIWLRITTYEGCYSAWVGSAGRWAYVFVGAVRVWIGARIVPVEGVGSTNIRKIGVDNCDGGNLRTIFPCKNLVTMLISC